MIFRRVKKHVKNEDWFAVFIDFFIVVTGVFLGIQLGNWNAARADKAAYMQALERFAVESRQNLKTLDGIDAGFASYLETASQAFDTLLSCEDNFENLAIVNKGLTGITGTYGLNLRSGALRELTSSPRLLAQQSSSERTALTNALYSFDLVNREANYIETIPLEERMQNNPILGVGKPTYRNVTYSGADYSRTHRPLILKVPISEACKNDQLIKSFYTWERWQGVLPAMTRQIRGALETAQTELAGENLANDDPGALIADYADDVSSLSLPELTLSFKDNLKALGSAETLRQQLTLFNSYQTRLQTVDKSEPSLCMRLDLALMADEIAFGLRRAELGLKFLSAETDIDGAVTLRDLPYGEDWYLFYLDRWNSASLEPSAVFAFGEAELKASVAVFDGLQAVMGFAGDDAGLAKHLAAPERWLDGGAETLAVFKALQETVRAKTPALFGGGFDVSPVTISRSDMGAAMPADGYYNGDEQTFFYNLRGEKFEARQADWLFLHEGTPGHHFQVMGSKHPRCTSVLPGRSYPAYQEGWGAYVETFGAELGAYQTPEAKLAAVQWNMVRSARVALDIGINFYGWSDDEAMNYWTKNVRGQTEIASREIARMRRWPAQVITYKYGADIFTRLSETYNPSLSADNRIKVHTTIIRNGAMPLGVLEDMFPALLNAERP